MKLSPHYIDSGCTENNLPVSFIDKSKLSIPDLNIMKTYVHFYVLDTSCFVVVDVIVLFCVCFSPLYISAA